MLDETSDRVLNIVVIFLSNLLGSVYESRVWYMLSLEHDLVTIRSSAMCPSGHVSCCTCRRSMYTVIVSGTHPARVIRVHSYDSAAGYICGQAHSTYYFTGIAMKLARRLACLVATLLFAGVSLVRSSPYTCQDQGTDRAYTTILKICRHDSTHFA
jgi:hypothetical protein